MKYTKSIIAINSTAKKKPVEEDKFSYYLKKVGLNIKSQLNFGQFVDIIRNQKLYNYDNGNNINGEEEEKNKEDVNINIKNSKEKNGKEEIVDNNKIKEEEIEEDKDK